MADTVKDWLRLVDGLYPEWHAADWDRVGLQIGDPDADVAHVLVTLDVTTAVLDEAAQLDSPLIIAHHPVMLHGLDRVTPATPTGKLVLDAVGKKVAVAAAHTNLDASRDGAGTSEPVMRALGIRHSSFLESVAALPREDASPATAPGMGLVGELAEPMSLRDLVEALREKLGTSDLRLAGDPDRVVTTVASVGGAGASMWTKARAAGADVLVTGDVSHHRALDALSMGMALIDAGHHGTENAAMPAFAAKLTSAAEQAGLGATVVLSQVDTSPWAAL